MDFDLYDDLLVGEDAPPSEREQKLIDENEALKKQKTESAEKLRILVGVNRKLAKKSEILEHNLSSLLKTARSEINRKNETIATLKREMDSLILRRSLSMGTMQEYKEVFATVATAMSNCGDYTKVLPIPGGEGNQDNFYIKTLDNELVQTVVCGNTSISMIKHGEKLNPSKVLVMKDNQQLTRKRKRESSSTLETPPAKKALASAKKPSPVKDNRKSWCDSKENVDKDSSRSRWLNRNHSKEDHRTKPSENPIVTKAAPVQDCSTARQQELQSSYKRPRSKEVIDRTYDFSNQHEEGQTVQIAENSVPAVASEINSLKETVTVRSSVSPTKETVDPCDRNRLKDTAVNLDETKRNSRSRTAASKVSDRDGRDNSSDKATKCKSSEAKNARNSRDNTTAMSSEEPTISGRGSRNRDLNISQRDAATDDLRFGKEKDFFPESRKCKRDNESKISKEEYNAGTRAKHRRRSRSRDRKRDREDDKKRVDGRRSDRKVGERRIDRQDLDRRTHSKEIDRKIDKGDRHRHNDKKDRHRDRKEKDSSPSRFDLRKSLVSKSRDSKETKRRETDRQRKDSSRSQPDTERKRQDSSRSDTNYHLKSSSKQTNPAEREKWKSNGENPKGKRKSLDLDTDPEASHNQNESSHFKVTYDLSDRNVFFSNTNDNLEEGEEEGEILDSDDEAAKEPQNLVTRKSKDTSLGNEKDNFESDSNSQNIERTMEQIFSSPTFANVVICKPSASSEIVETCKLFSQNKNQSKGHTESKYKTSDVPEKKKSRVQPEKVDQEPVLEDEEGLICSSDEEDTIENSNQDITKSNCSSKVDYPIKATERKDAQVVEKNIFKECSAEKQVKSPISVPILEAELPESEIQNIDETDQISTSEDILTSRRSCENFKKVGSFSSEDSLGGFNLSTSKDLPDDLANVDTVDLESLIQAKRDLMKQLEEKQKKYLKKMKKLAQPKIISAVGESADGETSQPGTQSLKIRICLPPKTITSDTPIQPDPQTFAFIPIQSPPFVTPQMSTQNSPSHLNETANPQTSDAPFEDSEGSEKPSTLWNVSNQTCSSQHKRLTPSSAQEDLPVLSTPKPSISRMKIPKIRRDCPSDSISPVVVHTQVDAVPEKKKSGYEPGTTEVDRPVQQTVSSPRTRSDSFSMKSPPEIVAVPNRASIMAKSMTPRHEFIGGFNSPAQFGKNSPAHFGIDSPRRRSNALTGGCSPEMSAVQWGLTGSQNLFSDSWNATPSPRCLQQTKNVDFNSTAGIASILKGELVTSGYISPGSGIIRTPTPTHMKTKLYTEPYSAATPRRSPRKRFVLTPSSESKSLQSTEASDLTPGKGQTWSTSLEATGNLTPGKDQSWDLSEKRKKFKNKKELFKSCGLEDSCSNSNFAIHPSAEAENPDVSGFSKNPDLTSLSSQKPVTAALAKETPINPKTSSDRKEASKHKERSSSLENKKRDNHGKYRESKSDKNREESTKKNRSRDRKDDQRRRDEHVLDKNTSEKASILEQSYKRSLVFSPENQSQQTDKSRADNQIMDKKISDKSGRMSTRRTPTKSRTSLSPTISKSSSPTKISSGEATNLSTKNPTTGLSLSDQILASYGLDGSHSLQLISHSKAVSHFPKNVVKVAKNEEKVPKKVDKSAKAALKLPKDVYKPHKDSIDFSKPEQTLSKIVYTSPKRDAFKNSRHSSGSRSTLSNGQKKTENCENLFSKSKRASSTSKTLLALCGLDDSPVKEPTTVTEKIVTEKKVVEKDLFPKKVPETNVSKSSQKSDKKVSEKDLSPPKNLVITSEKSEKEVPNKESLSKEVATLDRFSKKVSEKNTSKSSEKSMRKVSEKDLLAETISEKYHAKTVDKYEKEVSNKEPLLKEVATPDLFSKKNHERKQNESSEKFDKELLPKESLPKEVTENKSAIIDSTNDIIKEVKKEIADKKLSKHLKKKKICLSTSTQSLASFPSTPEIKIAAAASKIEISTEHISSTCTSKSLKQFDSIQVDLNLTTTDETDSSRAKNDETNSILVESRQAKSDETGSFQVTSNIGGKPYENCTQLPDRSKKSKSHKRRPVLSMSTQILASFSPCEPTRNLAKTDSNSTNFSSLGMSTIDVEVALEKSSVTENLDKESENTPRLTTSEKDSFNRSRLTSPTKRLVSSLGLDLSSSEDSDGDVKSPPKICSRKSPRKLSKTPENRAKTWLNLPEKR